MRASWADYFIITLLLGLIPALGAVIGYTVGWSASLSKAASGEEYAYAVFRDGIAVVSLKFPEETVVHGFKVGGEKYGVDEVVIRGGEIVNGTLIIPAGKKVSVMIPDVKPAKVVIQLDDRNLTARVLPETPDDFIHDLIIIGGPIFIVEAAVVAWLHTRI